ncbi:tyrosine--tRNA ligase [Candidatus Karelsulcia muelleri]|uniref:Tyrosine--tRNA ligase n=1 Tax=Candidatus Karelsulcia muelleri PSPU TaxID=1189303 RepID=A0AAD1AZ69_9FLAO|nr:tyrosine--tRNA ligase [Candidatus Karelsulcia muelleri]NJJ98860.1 tyrosine--tRNA ligase [Candidatus Karelsulcia muelleri]BAO66231.1 tyrosyl-tRNA synthetase [Candidatus Karelsulcia muelleri PSPU]
MKNLIKELFWRGLIHDSTYNEKIKNEIITLYTGFDPTYKSLHIGNLVAIIMLIHFQKYGHNIISVIGGGTGIIGDPSGKNSERNLIKKELLNYNIRNIRKQLSLYIDFNFKKSEILNNYEWFKKHLFIDFVRDIGKNFSINYMLTKDSIKKRISNKKSISFTEFTYQLLQAYDFFYLYKKKKCSLQIGGSDQWGNITSGIELIRKKLGVKVNGLTFPLITKLDGSKFGKTENGENIWIDPNLTSPYEFYQFWINITDDQAKQYIKIYTFLKKEEIKEIIYNHEKNPKLKLIQKTIADEITIFIHGKEIFNKVKFISNILFKKEKSIKKISINDIIYIYKYIPHKKIYIYNNFNIPILDLLVNKSNFLKSKKKAIRHLKLNSILINKKIVDEKFILKKNDLISESYVLLQKGKKKFFMIKFKK